MWRRPAAESAVGGDAPPPAERDLGAQWPRARVSRQAEAGQQRTSRRSGATPNELLFSASPHNPGIQREDDWPLRRTATVAARHRDRDPLVGREVSPVTYTPRSVPEATAGRPPN